MRKKWRPQIKPYVFLRGNQYTDFLFVKNTDIDSPFTCVKKLYFNMDNTSILEKVL